MVSTLGPERSSGTHAQRIERVLPAYHQLQLVAVLYSTSVAFWLLRLRELWTPFRDEVEAVWLLAAVWFGFLAVCAALLAPFHPPARFGAPVGIALLLVVAGNLDLDTRGFEIELWIGGLVGYLVGILARERESWRMLGKRPDLAFELVARPMLGIRSSLGRIEDAAEAAATCRRWMWRALGWTAGGTLVLLAVLHIAKRVPSLEDDRAARDRLWNAHDLASLRSWGVRSGYLDADLERLAAYPDWQEQWPRMGGGSFLGEPVGYLEHAEGRPMIWREKAFVGSSLALPVDWVRIRGEWRVLYLGVPEPIQITVSGSRPASLWLPEEPDPPERLGLGR